jgi:hypothetical protein
MPELAKLDRPLNALLADLVAPLAGAEAGGVLLPAAELNGAPAGCLDALSGHGLLAPAEPARATICDGCERCCVMEVERDASAGAGRERAFILCDKRDDIGRVQVDPDRLRQWQVTRAGLAAAVSRALGTDRPPTEGRDGQAWNLGMIELGGRAVDIVLATGTDAAGTSPGLAVTLAELNSAAKTPAIGVTRLLRFKDGVLIANRAALKQALGSRYDDRTLACEIRLALGEIVLVNHVTGARRTLARPDFNSANDNVFTKLFEHPGQAYSRGEIRKIAGQRKPPNLHKILDNLGFKGPLKRMFFRVSADAIVFSRSVTVGQLATLRIDPKAIS